MNDTSKHIKKTYHTPNMEVCGFNETHIICTSVAPDKIVIRVRESSATSADVLSKDRNSFGLSWGLDKDRTDTFSH